MRSDKKLRWLVAARNQIEKQGDLNAKSRFIVEYISALSPASARLLELPPNTRPKKIAGTIASMYPAAAHTDGAVLKLSREWIDSEFPDEELLSLLIYAYTSLRDLIIDAHQLMESERRDSCSFYGTLNRFNSRLPKEMTKFHFPAVSWFSLQQGVLKDYERKTKTFSPASLKKLSRQGMDRYGIENALPQLAAEASFSENCDHFFKIGKQMLLADGFHLMIALVKSNNEFNIVQLKPDDRTDLHVMMNELASYCARVQANSCILITESWIAKPSTKHGPFAVNYPNRREALTLDGFHKTEGFQSRCAIFQREAERILFEESEENDVEVRSYGASGFAVVANAIRASHPMNE